MMGPTHRLFGAACGATVATWSGQPTAMVVATAVIASATSHGWLSPDLDQSRPWVMLRRSWPALGRYMHHRTGITHWWALPVIAWALIGASFPAQAQWAAHALVIGWSSHLIGDALFGQIPLWPRGPMIGAGLRTDGFWESGKVLGYRLLPITPVQLALLGWLGWILRPTLPSDLQPVAHDLLTQITLAG